MKRIWREAWGRMTKKRGLAVGRPINIPTDKLVKVTVNGKPLEVPSTATIMQACQLAGIDVPRFCYHDRLGVAGNCRMCLVQVNEGPKLVASCAAPIMPDMRIATDSNPVKRGREGVMEFLLANHPLDCPICDQGGECDLQDQAMAFGSDQSRFSVGRQPKRAVEDKNFGPLVATSMNRCIHCTRCVRFANEIAGVPELGTTGRGNDMQIGTYIDKMIDSPLSGNIIDLCPVGALTSKPYAFTARPWELRRTDSIDVMDAVGTNIKIDSRGMEVMRIIPRLNEDINEEWLADKGRFSYDGLRQQRLVQPLVRQGGQLVPIGWEDALVIAADRIKAVAPESITIVAGRFADVETLCVAKELFGKSSHYVIDGCSLDNSVVDSRLFGELRFSTTMAGIEEADAILLIGCNPLIEAPLVNARIRKAWLRPDRDVKIGLVGQANINLTFTYEHLGEDVGALAELRPEGNAFWRVLWEAKRPMIIVGQQVLFNHPDAAWTIKLLRNLAASLDCKLFQENAGQDGAEGWNGLSLLPLTAGFTGALMTGYLPYSIRPDSKLVYLMAADDFKPTSIPSSAFVIYQGHHGDVGAHRADLILPTAAYTEKEATFVNLEGRPQRTRAAVAPPGEAREDWTILRALSEFLPGHNSNNPCLPFDDLYGLCTHLGQQYPVLHSLNQVIRGEVREQLFSSHIRTSSELPEKPTSYGLAKQDDYYLTDCISRNSRIMAECSLVFTYHQHRDQASDNHKDNIMLSP